MATPPRGLGTKPPAIVSYAVSELEGSIVSIVPAEDNIIIIQVLYLFYFEFDICNSSVFVYFQLIKVFP